MNFRPRSNRLRGSPAGPVYHARRARPSLARAGGSDTKARRHQSALIRNPQSHMKCLIIKQPYVDQILAGTKPVEFRGRATSIRGRIGLIASGQMGVILGTVELFACMGGDGKFEWMLREPRRLAAPVRFEQPHGCVIWVNGPEITQESDPAGLVGQPCGHHGTSEPNLIGPFDRTPPAPGYS